MTDETELQRLRRDLADAHWVIAALVMQRGGEARIGLSEIEALPPGVVIEATEEGETLGPRVFVIRVLSPATSPAPTG